MTSEPRSRRLIRGLAVLSALTLLAAACGDDDAADEDASSSTDSVGTTEPEAATTEAPTVTVAAVTDTTEAAAVTTAGTETSAPAGISEADWEAIVATAQEEGKVTIYSSQGLDQLNELASGSRRSTASSVEVVRDIDSGADPQGRGRARHRQRHRRRHRSGQRGVGSRQGGRGLVRRRPSARRSTTRLTTRPLNVSADGGYFMSIGAVLTFGWNTDQYPTGSRTTPTCSIRSSPAARSA